MADDFGVLFNREFAPALGRDRAELLLHDRERDSGLTCLLDLPPMRISVEAEVTDGDLSLVGNIGIAGVRTYPDFSGDLAEPRFTPSIAQDQGSFRGPA